MISNNLIFSVDRGINQKKRTENFCNNALHAFVRFSILFWLIPQLTKKILNLFLKCVYIDLHGSFLVLITFEIYRLP